MARILALDIGEKRTGIAVTDPLCIIAQGLTTVGTVELIPWLREYMEGEAVKLLIWGLPKSLAGTDTDGTVHALNAAASIGRSFPSLPLESVDERFSSSMAFQGLIDAGARKKKRQDKGLLDKMSAVQLLQTYLNRNVL
ncbi:MAG: Holliday junction resolvase RuvX [Bacteroidia bacterium]|jgi:putative Holliday junction resolvase